MKELTLEHLAAYLPYGLKCQVTDNGEIKIAELNGLYSNSECVFADLIESQQGFEQIKPVLRPLSDLTKEITHDGKTFVPIVELAKIGVEEFPSGKCVVEGNDVSQVVHLSDGSIFGFDRNGFYFKECRKPLHVSSQLQLFQKLHSWHFDLYGLLESNLAVDINTVKQ